jgi:pyridoxal phosphate enzyme (YggS family)
MSEVPGRAPRPNDPPGPRSETVAANVERVRRGIERACRRAGRDPDEVRLVAAAKTVPARVVRWAVEAGIRDVGENYVKELRAKRGELSGVRWHYIGALQSHTAHHVAELADVVETVGSQRAASRLARRAVERGRRIEALIEVDFTGARAGVSAEGLGELADSVASLEGLALVGLMTLPPLPERAEESRAYFARLRGLADGLRAGHSQVVELSMGMSLDYEVAVEEGATMIRIGTALFGDRPPVTQAPET